MMDVYEVAVDPPSAVTPDHLCVDMLEATWSRLDKVRYASQRAFVEHAGRVGPDRRPVRQHTQVGVRALRHVAYSEMH